MADHHPLDWPAGYPRTDHRQTSRFQTSLADARDGLLEELERMGAKNVVISSNIETYERGGRRIPYANQAEPSDPGIAVYFQWREEPYALACDHWQKTAGNMQALRKTVAAMRGLERWKVSDMLKRTFSGFKALPGEGETAGNSWWEVLDIPRKSATPEKVRHAYRKRSKDLHPDQGGSPAEWHRLQDAYERALEAVN